MDENPNKAPSSTVDSSMRPGDRYAMAVVFYLNAAVSIWESFRGLTSGETYRAVVPMISAIGFACLGVGIVQPDRRRFVHVGVALLICFAVAFLGRELLMPKN
jgi:hypothetical protein